MGRHFSLEDVVDFTRNTMSSEKRQSFQAHLDEGCATCEALVEMWRAMLALQADLDYEPPPTVLRRAEALFAGEKVRGAFEHAVEMARLVFDSQLGVAAAGTRKGATGLGGARKLVYECRDLVIDLQVDAETPGQRTVIGQIVAPPSIHDNIVWENAPVRLYRDQHLIASTQANRFGEFQLQFETASDLTLAVELPGLAVAIPLDAVSSQPTVERPPPPDRPPPDQEQ